MRSGRIRGQESLVCLILRSTRGGSEAQDFCGDITTKNGNSNRLSIYMYHFNILHPQIPNPLSRVHVIAILVVTVP